MIRLIIGVFWIVALLGGGPLATAGAIATGVPPWAAVLLGALALLVTVGALAIATDGFKEQRR